MREQVHTYMERGGGVARAGGGKKGERRGSSRGHCLSHLGVDMCRPEPSMPVSGVEERENRVR